MANQQDLPGLQRRLYTVSQQRRSAVGKQLSAGMFQELGTSGLKRFGGEIDDEFLKELRGERGRRNLREFAENSPVAGGFIWTYTSLATGTTWDLEPASSSPADEAIAEFIRGALFDDMALSWTDNLLEILSFPIFGWSYHELVFKRRRGPEADPPSKFTDGRIGWRKWPIRSQESLDQWAFDEHGGVIGLWQDPGGLGGPRRFIPIEKALLFRTSPARNNPEGRSILRSAWPTYYRSKHIENVLGIGIERDLAGYPYFQVKAPDPSKQLTVPDIHNPNDSDAVNTLAEYKRIARSIKRDEQEGMVLPWWIDFKLAATEGRRQFDVEKVLVRYDRLIALSVLADFLLIGHEAVGSKALVSSRLGLFESALIGLLKSVTETINRFAIPQLLRLNGIPFDEAPRLVHGPITEVDLLELGNYLGKLAGSGMPLFGASSADLERTLLAAARLPATGVQDEGDRAS